MLEVRSQKPAIKIFIVMAAVLAFVFQPVSAVNWYVSPDGNDTNSGTNWSEARETIQSAVAGATNNGDIVWVTNGVYDTGGRYSAPLTNRVFMTNAIILQSVNGPTGTFIVGYDKTRCIYMTNGAQLIGFTLTNGSAVPSSHGGGVILFTNCVVSNCVIAGNEADINGGGAYLQGGTLDNCMLSGNSAINGGSGGGAYGGKLNNCTLTDNLADYGGGAGYSALNNCILSGNSADSYGGGTYYGTLNNCTLSSNSADSYGGGAYGGTLNNCTLSSNSSDTGGGGASYATLNNCVVLSNSSVNYGGGAYYGTLNNCTLSGNSSDEGGGAMNATLNNCGLFRNSARLGGGAYDGTLNNCTVVSNSTVSVGGGASGADVRNCIVYYNTIYDTAPAKTNGDLNTCDSKYTCASDAPAGNGNITAAPQFVNRDAGDYRLSSGSPCIGTGLNSYAPTNVTPYDLDNLPRIMGAGVDMGACEYWLFVIGTNGTLIGDGEEPSSSKGTAFGQVLTNTLVLTNAVTNSISFNSWTTNGQRASAFSAAGIPAQLSAGAAGSNFTLQFNPSAFPGLSCTAVIEIATSVSTSYFRLNVYGYVPAVVIGLSTNSLSFSAAYGSDPSAQSVVLTNSGFSPYNFTNTVSYGTGGSGWLNVSPTAGIVAAAGAQICTAAVTGAGLNAGTYTATNQITSPEATNSPQEVTVSLTIGKADQTISFPAIAGQTTTSLVQLAATASSGLPVTNFAVLSGPGVISGLTNLTFTNSGGVSVTADQAGNTNWNSASTVTNTFSVTGVTALVTLNNLTQTYDGGAKTVTATTEPAELTVDITYDGNDWAPTNAGTYAVTGTVNDAIYQGSTNGTLTVSKGSQTITNFTPANGSAFMTTNTVRLAALASSGLPVSFNIASGPGTISSDNILTFTGIGPVNVAAGQTGNTCWNTAHGVTNTFIINDVSFLAAPLNVTASDGTYTGKVALTWDVVSGARGYQIWRAGENNIEAAVNLSNIAATSYDDDSSAVWPATMFYYWIKAWNSIATSEFNNVDDGFCRMSPEAEIISGQPVAGDYDGDGKADPAVYNLADGRLFIWLSSAGYVLVTPAATFQVSAGDLPITGDFDGDALADPGIFEHKNGSWYVWLSSAAYSRIGPLLFGVNVNDIPVVADFDGDGKADPAVYHASTGRWYMWLSGAGYMQFGPFPFRQSLVDIPVPGQFDGGGLAAPAVYQSASGAWYVWLANAGYLPIGPVTFGTADNHIAVPADYDGDLLTDPASYVPSSGKWRMWMSGSGYALTEVELR